MAVFILHFPIYNQKYNQGNKHTLGLHITS